MKAHSWWVYLVAVLVAVISLWATSRFSQNQWVKILTAAPFPVALLTILFQIFRDNLALERKRILQNENNDFILSATSHLADVSFDKHIVFAEKYAAEVHRCIAELIQIGATKNALQLAGGLRAIRLEFTIWETDSVSKTLDEFEHALQKIGAQMEGIRESPASDERSKQLREIYDVLRKVLGFEAAPEALSDETIGRVVIQRLRDLLGITELTKLRQYYIKKAIERCDRL